MAIHEKVTSHSVSVFHNNITPDVGYRILLTLELSGRAEIFFKAAPPYDPPVFSNGLVVAQMPDTQFVHAYHMLQTEHTVFLSVLNLFGLTTVNLTTDPNLNLAFTPAEDARVQEAVLEMAKAIEVSRKIGETRTDA